MEELKVDDFEEFGSFRVQPSKDFFFFDEEMEGTIFMNITNAANFEPKAILVTIKGEERTKINAQGKECTGYDLFLEDTIKIQKFKQNEMIGLGAYEYGFKLTIKEKDYPPSFFYQSSFSKIEAQIQYSIEATLKMRKGKKPIVSNHPIDIKTNPPTKQKIEPLIISLNQGVLSGCCDKGETALHVHFPSLIETKEEINLFCDIDNSKCKCPVTGLKFKLSQTIKARGDGGESVTDTKILNTVEKKLNHQPLTADDSTITVLVSPSIPPSEFDEEPTNKSQGRNYALSKRPPNFLAKKFQISYELLYGITHGNVCCPPTVQDAVIPISVYENPSTERKDVYDPPEINWHPLNQKKYNEPWVLEKFQHKKGQAQRVKQVNNKI